MKKTLTVILVSLIFIFLFAMQLFLARTDSQTTDEGVHLSAGYTYLTKFDFRFNPEHPPLVKYLAGAPLLFAKFNTPADQAYFDQAGQFFHDSWREARNYGEDLLYGLSNNAQRILLLSRLPMIFLTLLLGFTIFYISSKTWGIKGGIFSVVLFVLEPLILAHGHFVTTDIAVSLGYLFSSFILWRFANKPNVKNAILFGVVLGITQLLKFTAIIFIPGAIVLLVYFAITARQKIKQFIGSFWKLLLAFVVAWVVIWAGYMFKVTTFPAHNDSAEKLSVISGMSDSPYYKYLRPVLIPRDYFKGLTIVLGHTQVGHDSFLLGQHSKTGWWYYFPVVFATKTSIPFLVIILLSLILVFKDKPNRRFSGFMLLSALVFFVFAMSSKADLGVRHVMPVYAILFVMSGIIPGVLNKSKIGTYFIALMLLFLAYENYKAFPYYMSYYNEASGGILNGHKIATDSNYDWGQDLIRIRNYVVEHDLNDYVIEYSWDSDKALSYYGLPTKKYSPDDKTNKYIIVNATALNNPPFDSLQTKQVYDRITPAVFVYELNNADATQD